MLRLSDLGAFQFEFSAPRLKGIENREMNIRGSQTFVPNIVDPTSTDSRKLCLLLERFHISYEADRDYAAFS